MLSRFSRAVWISTRFRTFIYLVKTYAPWSLIVQKLKMSKFDQDLKVRFSKQVFDFSQEKRLLLVTRDWFSINIPHWEFITSRYALQTRPLEVLEIGSWEGLSTYWMLKNWPNCHITCVDTWEGGDEHKDGSAATKEILDNYENNFDSNLKAYETRITKVKTRSINFFGSSNQQFDVIYVDGSHNVCDVFVDVMESYARLRVGGLLILDDYFWRHYLNIYQNPAVAINLFLRIASGTYSLVHFNHQIVIQKDLPAKPNVKNLLY